MDCCFEKIRGGVWLVPTRALSFGPKGYGRGGVHPVRDAPSVLTLPQSTLTEKTWMTAQGAQQFWQPYQNTNDDNAEEVGTPEGVVSLAGPLYLFSLGPLASCAITQ